MSLGFAFGLLGIAALLAALVAQVRWMELERSAFERKRRRVAMGLAGLLLTFGLVLYVASGGLDWVFAPEEDGSWRAITIDGRPVADEGYTILIRSGQVIAGFDGCNSWHYEDASTAPDGSRSIMTTLAGCAKTPTIHAYWMTARAGVRPIVLPAQTIAVEANGHRAVFRRCEWQAAYRPELGGRACLFDEPSSG